MEKKSNTFSANIGKIEKIIGYTFKDKSLLAQAFTRTSYCNEHNGKGERYQSNEVLEFFGDGVLSVAIISFLLKDCTERYEHGISTALTEGDFSNIKSKLSDKKNLSASTLALGLEKYLQMGEGDTKLGIEKEPSVMEDLFESIVGAVYIDCDMSIPTVMQVVSNMLDISVYTSATPPIQSSKNAVQEWCADKKRRLPPPVYKTISESGPDHKKVYERGCYIGDRLLGKGVGKNMKIADGIAAEEALKALKAEDGAKEITVKPAPPAAPTPKDEAKAKERKAPTKKPTIVDKKTAQKKTEKPAPKSKATVKSAEKPAKIATRPTAAATLILKNYASSHKTATPTFKDLGEAKTKNGKSEYRIECRFLGSSVIGTGDSRTSARESAAGIMAKQLSIGTAKKPRPQYKQRPRPIKKG